MRLEDRQPFSSPEEALAHFGIKGMKWGVRKNQEPKPELKGLIDKPIVRTTKNGDTLTLSPKSPNPLNKALAKFSSNYRESYNKSAYLTIEDSDGKKIGTFDFWHKNDHDVYLNWVTIDKSTRGKGYATEVLKAAEEHSRAAGKTRMILEVPGNAPDARHIYEKQGFKATKVLSTPKNDTYWGGLTEMEKTLQD